MAAKPNNKIYRGPVDIGAFRKIRLMRPDNFKGKYVVFWADAANKAYDTKRESCRTAELAEAEAYFDDFCNTVRQATQTVALGAGGGKTAVIIPSVDELCRRWLDHVTPAGKDKTGRNVLGNPRRLLGHHGGDQVTAKMLQAYGEERRREKDAANNTIRRELGGLRTVLKWAARQKLISHDDVPEFDEAVMPAEGSPRDLFLDEAQQKYVWDQALVWPDKRIKLFVCLGLETAARREAIVELTWDRIDMVLGQIDYRMPGRRTTRKRRVKGLPVSDRLMPVIKEAWLAAPKDATGRATGPVVGFKRADNVGAYFRPFSRAIGLPWVTPHVLRHSWGSLKAMKGVSLYDIAKVMGDTLATIEKYYLHLTPDHLKRAVNA